MDDLALIIVAVAFELGVPVAAAVAFWRLPALRPKLAVLLGAVTPLLFLYGAITVAYLMDPHDQSNRFAFFAGWEMTLMAYLLAVGLGVALSFTPWPTHLLGRYVMGLMPLGIFVASVW